MTKIQVNPDFKFQFETEKELHKAKALGYIDLCDIVRICVKHIDVDYTVDYPVKSREDYLNEIERINNNDNIELINVYQDKWYYDIAEYI